MGRQYRNRIGMVHAWRRFPRVGIALMAMTGRNILTARRSVGDALFSAQGDALYLSRYQRQRDSNSEFAPEEHAHLQNNTSDAEVDPAKYFNASAWVPASNKSRGHLNRRVPVHFRIRGAHFAHAIPLAVAGPTHRSWRLRALSLSQRL